MKTDLQHLPITQSAGVPPFSADIAPLAFLAQARAQGDAGALVTISAIDGGAPKALGTQLAVLADGRHVGHVSGGCVEPAIAAEVAAMMSSGGDRIIRFGRGSPFMDIRFPCGGGVDLLVHVNPDPALLVEAIDRTSRRTPFSIRFDPALSRAWLEEASVPSGWHEGTFVRRYLPRTRLLLLGRGPDVEMLARVALAVDNELVCATPDESTRAALAHLGVTALPMPSANQAIELPIDRWTATVLLFHEHEWESAILARAVTAEGFYLGALGSVKTHRLRRERLAAMGVAEPLIDRIRGPIGLIDRARDSATLALSVLSEIAAQRSQLDQL